MAQSVGGDKSCPDLFWSGSHDRARSPLVCHRVASAAGEPNSCSCVRRLSPVSHLSSLFGVSVLDVRAALTCPDSVQDAVSLRSLPLLFQPISMVELVSQRMVYRLAFQSPFSTKYLKNTSLL